MNGQRDLAWVARSWVARAISPACMSSLHSVSARRARDDMVPSLVVPMIASAVPSAGPSGQTTYVALGVLSAAGAAEKSNAEQYRSRRMRLRNDCKSFQSFGREVALRFVLAGAPTRKNGAALAAAHREATEHGDVVLLNTTEGRFVCSRKYLMWLREALILFPTAAYIGLGDDDTYIQLDHFFADLRSVRIDKSTTSHVLWGLVMWKAYYNNETMVTSTGFTGWGFTDWAAVAQRSQMEACREPSVNATQVCPGLRNDHIEAARQNQIGSPPFPMVNGPLSALSRELAIDVANDAYPPRWLAALVRTPRIAASLARRGGPRRSSFACWPVVDSILGYWVTRIGLERKATVTLVNTPLMKQHHPWPSAIKGRFSNSSIVLHGLKKPVHERYRHLAISRGSGRRQPVVTARPCVSLFLLPDSGCRATGPFEPFNRECGTCKEMGWSTWPDSPLNSWRCCGTRMEPQRLKHACRGRLCPRTPRKASAHHGEQSLAATPSGDAVLAAPTVVPTATASASSWDDASLAGGPIEEVAVGAALGDAAHTPSPGSLAVAMFGMPTSMRGDVGAERVANGQTAAAALPGVPIRRAGGRKSRQSLHDVDSKIEVLEAKLQTLRTQRRTIERGVYSLLDPVSAAAAGADEFEVATANRRATEPLVAGA